MAKKEITAYRYDFRNLPDENVAILLLFNNNDLLCMAAFIDEDKQELPPPHEGANGVVFVSYRYKWLSNIVDMLRNEKPVFFDWNRQEQLAFITTSEEPVGEEEYKSFWKHLFG
jgi:hypothetical protein